MKSKIIIAALIGICTFMHGCNNAEGRKEMGPGEVAECFCRAVAGGEFGKAMELCDAEAMKTYIDGQSEAWNRLAEQDSSAFVIAAQMLSEAEITVDDIVKEGDRRHVFCMVGFNGEAKGKLIILHKEEGEWKVESIADRP